MDMAVEDRLARYQADVGADIEALDGRIGAQDVQPQSSEQIIRRGEFVVGEVEVGRGVAIRKNERVQRSDWCRVADGERKPIANHDTRAVPQRAKYASLRIRICRWFRHRPFRPRVTIVSTPCQFPQGVPRVKVSMNEYSTVTSGC